MRDEHCACEHAAAHAPTCLRQASDEAALCISCLCVCCLCRRRRRTKPPAWRRRRQHGARDTLLYKRLQAAVPLLLWP